MTRHQYFKYRSGFVQIGSRLQADGRFLCVRKVTDTQILAEAAADGQLELFNIDDIPTMIRNRRLVVCESDDPEYQLEEMLNRTIDSLSPRQQSEAIRRKPFIAEAIRRKPITNAQWDSIGQEIGLVAGSGGPVTGRTVRNWVKQFEKWRARGYQAVTPEYHKRGNRSRLPSAQLDLLDQAAHKGYFASRGETYAHAHRVYLNLLNEWNKGNPSQRMPAVTAQTVWNYIRKNYHPFDVYAAKHGLEEAKRHWKARQLPPRPERPLECVIIDCTRADIVIVVPELGIKVRPWLTLVIDWATRAIIAIWVTLLPPSEETLFQTLRLAFSPKGELRAAMDLEGEGFHGVPLLILVDNALEFHSNSLRLAAAALGFTIEYCPKGQPWMKGVGERAFRTLNFALHALPGTTFSNPLKRGKYDPYANASLTLEDLRRWLVKWAEAYNTEPHREIGKSPNRAWDERRADAEARWLRDIAEVDVLLNRASEAPITADGVLFHGLLFDSMELKYFYGGPSRNTPSEIRYDSADLGYIWVRPLNHHSFIMVPALWRAYALGLSLTIHLELRRRVAASMASELTEKTYLTALAAFITETQSLIDGSRSRRDRSFVSISKHLIKPPSTVVSSSPQPEPDPIAAPHQVPLGDPAAPGVGTIVGPAEIRHRSKAQKASRPAKTKRAHAREDVRSDKQSVPTGRPASAEIDFDPISHLSRMSWGTPRTGT